MYRTFHPHHRLILPRRTIVTAENRFGPMKTEVVSASWNEYIERVKTTRRILHNHHEDEPWFEAVGTSISDEFIGGMRVPYINVYAKDSSIAEKNLPEMVNEIRVEVSAGFDITEVKYQSTSSLACDDPFDCGVGGIHCTYETIDNNTGDASSTCTVVWNNGGIFNG